MAPPLSTGKRRATDGAEKPAHKKKAGEVEGQVKMAVEEAAGVGPALVSLSDFCPDKSTRFSIYAAPSDVMEGGKDKDTPASMDDRLLLAADAGVMQYTSSNWGWGASAQAPPELRRETRGYSGDYLLGVYDPAEKSVTLRKVPMFTLNRSVKALSNLSTMATERGQKDAFDYTKARRDLGEAFGNKKQKQAARNMDRMKVNTENMDNILEHVALGIDESSASLPTEGELSAALNASRALPKANLEAKEPAEVYPLESLVPPATLKALHTRSLLKCTSSSELGKSMRVLSMPSPWLLPLLWNHVQTAQNDAGSTSKAMELVRLGYLVAILLTFRKQTRLLNKSDDGATQLAQKMRLPDHEKDIVIEYLLSQFAEQSRGTQRCVFCADLSSTVTSTGETRLLATIVVLALHLDNFSVSSQRIAQELGVPAQSQ
ncbi:DNA-directed RNA polymerase I subunit rpa49 [Malassezia nana]|uniref:DNA-directed RNA polymerase I subunit rpa49 n=1 Tax=Malassezia nana TaxID=180528 RepID=A0AAF0EJS2_9BASI|nr:DNA-directed RNA polymerase I subunit rpa49 [Malassezia nana]